MSTQSTTSGGAAKPPRAEPLQPDRPSKGTGTVSPEGADAADAKAQSKDTSKRQRKQSEAALENVREGYG